MERNIFNNKNEFKYQNSLSSVNSDVLKFNNNNDKIENKLKLRKKAYNKILMKKTAIFIEEITNEKLDELEQLDYEQQYKIIKNYLISNNEQNIIKILTYIIKVFCPLPLESKIKMKLLDEGIIDNILIIFYTTNNNNIFSLCSSILSIFCTNYILFSLKMINEEGIKKIYNELQNKYFNNPYVISNCITCYKESLQHLFEELNSKDSDEKHNENIKDISYDSKRLLCNFANWILYNKTIFNSLPQEGSQSFFKLLELLIISVSVPNNYEMNFYLNYNSLNDNSYNVHFENIIFYTLINPIKDLDYDTFDNYLSLLIQISKDEKYLLYLTQKYNNICIYDVIKKLFGFTYLNNNSTDEDRLNNPILEPNFIRDLFKIMENLLLETINHEDIMSLILKFFKNYRASVRYTEMVPLAIMQFFVKLSEYINQNKKIYDFIFSPQNIINDCIKFYTRNNNCYILVMKFLVHIFAFKNFTEIENLDLNTVIKCFVDGLESKDLEVVKKSVYYLGIMLEIQKKNQYKIDLILKYEENQVVEKLNLLTLNKNNNIGEVENAELLLNYIENEIKKEEK